MRLKKKPLILNKPTPKTKEAKNAAKEVKHSAVEEKAILLTTQRDFDEPIDKLKLEAEQAKAILKKHTKTAKKAKTIKKKRTSLIQEITRSPKQAN